MLNCALIMFQGSSNTTEMYQSLYKIDTPAVLSS